MPEFRGNEALGLIRSGLRDFSISRTSVDWGIPLPWDSKHVAYVWFDALTNYLSAVGFGRDDEEFAAWWPADVQLIGKDIIRFHCVYWPAMLLSAGIEPPRRFAVGGWLLVDSEKMSKTTGNVVKPLDLVDTVGVDGLRYYVLADTPYGNDGDFTRDGLIGRYNADLANNLGNLTSRIATVVGSKCGGIGPAPVAGGPLSEAAETAVAAAIGGVGRRRSAPRPRGDVVADPGDQRLPRGQRAVEGGARPRRRRRPRRRHRGAAHRHRARVAGDPGNGAADLGAPRPARRGHRPARPERHAVGRLPRRTRRSPRASRCSRASRSDRVTDRQRTLEPPSTWLVRQPLPPLRRAARAAQTPSIAEARAAGVTTMIVVGCDRATSIAATADSPPTTTASTPRSGCIRTRLATASTRSSTSIGPDTVAIGECGLDYYYDHSPRDAQREAFAAQIALADRHRPDPRRPHPRSLGRHVRRARRQPASRRGSCSTASPAVPTRRARRSIAGATSASPGSSRSRAPTTCATPPELCPDDRLLIETDSPYLAPVPHRGKLNRPAWVPAVGACLADLRGESVANVCSTTAAASRSAFPGTG